MIVQNRSDKRHARLISPRFCSCCSDPPPAPDYGPVAQASEESALLSMAMSMEQLDFAKQQWGEQSAMMSGLMEQQAQAAADELDLRKSSAGVQSAVANQQMALASEQARYGREDRQRYKELYQPLEENLVKEFQEYDTPERQALESGQAISDVERAFSAQRENAQQRLESLGVDPSQTRSQALDAGIRAQEAAAQAAAGTTARRNVQDVGRALRAEAINIGRGMPSQVAASYQGAVQAGQGASGAGSGMASAASGMGGVYNPAITAAGGNMSNAVNMMGQSGNWMGNANQAIGNWGNTLNMGFGNEMDSWNAGGAGWGALGNLTGTLGSAYLLGRAEGGEVQGPGGPKDDAIPAALSDGEFVVPAEVVARKGTEFFDKLVQKTRDDIGYVPPQTALPPPAMGGMGVTPGPLPLAEGGKVDTSDLKARAQEMVAGYKARMPEMKANAQEMMANLPNRLSDTNPMKAQLQQRLEQKQQMQQVAPYADRRLSALPDAVEGYARMSPEIQQQAAQHGMVMDYARSQNPHVKFPKLHQLYNAQDQRLTSPFYDVDPNVGRWNDSTETYEYGPGVRMGTGINEGQPVRLEPGRELRAGQRIGIDTFNPYQDMSNASTAHDYITVSPEFAEQYNAQFAQPVAPPGIAVDPGMATRISDLRAKYGLG